MKMNDKKEKKVIDSFCNVENNSKLLESIINIQNNINVFGNSKIIAISSPTDKGLYGALIAKVMAEVYAKELDKTLLIDCDFYNSFLSDIINKKQSFNNIQFINSIVLDEYNKEKFIYKVNDKLDIVFSSCEVYPTKIFNSENFKRFLKENSEKYDHIVLNMPSIPYHQDFLLIKELITSIVLVTKRDFTKKCDLFNSINILKNYDINCFCTIYMK